MCLKCVLYAGCYPSEEEMCPWSSCVPQRILVSVWILMCVARPPLTRRRTRAVLCSASSTDTAKSSTRHWHMQVNTGSCSVRCVCVCARAEHTRSHVLCAGAPITSPAGQSWSSALHEELRSHDGDAHISAPGALQTHHFILLSEKWAELQLPQLLYLLGVKWHYIYICSCGIKDHMNRHWKWQTFTNPH